MSELEKKNALDDAAVENVAGGVTYDGYFTYTVVYGDSLSAIASRYRTTPAVLARLNNLTSPYFLTIGQTLLIPKA